MVVKEPKTATSVAVQRTAGQPMAAYLALPDGEGPFPGIVVIQKIFGLNENIRQIAQRFSREGYSTLAVDLFSTGNRVACMLRIFYGMLMRPLANGIVADIQAAVGFLMEWPGVDPGRVGVIGFCMGGSYALQLACMADPLTGSGQALRAASVFYEMNPRPLEAVARACPVVGSYPEKDFTAKAARQLEPLLEKHHIPHDIRVYPEARHSFFNDTGPAYHPEAAADAWKRTLAFFDIHLKSAQVETG
jgi:carboxymethylenebutenolidase